MTHVFLPHSVGRAALAAPAAALLALGLAAPASADPGQTYEGAVRAQYPGTAASGANVRINGTSESTSLFDLQLEDGTVLTAYCVDLETRIRDGAWYLEDEWATYPGRGDFAEPGRVHWILQNGFPTISAEQLAENAGLDSRDALRFGDAQAIAATQAAIWHFSNGAELTAGDADAVETIYDHLVESAQDMPQEPGPTLSVTSGETSGQAGQTIGEFLVETSDEDGIEVSVEAPEGVEVDLVDIETGEAVTTVNDGDVVGLSVPEGAQDGTASFSLETTATVESGRLFKGEEAAQPTQTLITAESGEVTVSASASVSWTGGGQTPPPSDEPSEESSEEPSGEPSEEPSREPSGEPSEKPSEPADDQNEPSLPVTGGALLGLVAAGVAALGAGGGALYLSRGRKTAGAEDVED